MGYNRKGQLVKSMEWGKLKGFFRRYFWKRERMAEKKEIKRQRDGY